MPGLVKLQRELLASAIALTRPGGVVVYATCSPHLAETVGVVADGVRRHPVTAVDTRPLFGLGGATTYDRIELTWPDGTRAAFPGGPADRWVNLTPGSGNPR